ncbi:serine/arginine repetitive matrix protein 1-like [Choloepus didactylus]|uniref:serine/arginine repetitive matrix protein 1-like n=1 Tax=Choloepus didactylus TaxID=27675 RepID=UPI00189F4F48|nr:serine/arginine repetitive matrix protein 1-like [Choloepus didactylus]
MGKLRPGEGKEPDWGHPVGEGPGGNDDLQSSAPAKRHGLRASRALRGPAGRSGSERLPHSSPAQALRHTRDHPNQENRSPRMGARSRHANPSRTHPLRHKGPGPRNSPLPSTIPAPSQSSRTQALLGRKRRISGRGARPLSRPPAVPPLTSPPPLRSRGARLRAPPLAPRPPQPPPRLARRHRVGAGTGAGPQPARQLLWPVAHCGRPSEANRGARAGPFCPHRGGGGFDRRRPAGVPRCPQPFGLGD